MAEEKCIPVRVALRVRPLVTKEISEGCQHSLSFVPGQPQVIVGQDKGFTYDYVFPCDSLQSQLYEAAVADRIDYLFKGYNVTVLAYGQTGSGKTYTMGTSHTPSCGDHERGIIQRAVEDIFKGIEQLSEDNEFLIKVSFLEVYKEDVYDLLEKNKDVPITIREDHDGIRIVGLTEQPVTSATETFRTLEQGSLSRTTASTAMNARSSRSHAIFTITVEQRALSDSMDFKRAKFHLVDLAGSERANKTGALGERFKEGVNINRGLLALGNVISALCDDASHVPYRDSKLTRLLQDSLGGNSHTIMIACVSPADSNLDETLNTLRYADRARKIKNKPIVNRDPQNAELMRLRQQVQQLQIQLLQNQGMTANKIVSPDHKPEDLKLLLERNKHLEHENHRLAKELQSALDQTAALCEKAMLAEVGKEKLVSKMEQLQCKTNQTIEALMELTEDDPKLQDQMQMLKEWQEKIVEIQCDQIHKDQEFSIYSPARKVQISSPDTLELDSSDSGEENCSADEGECNGSNNLPLRSTLKQAAMNRELQELDRALARKEEIASKMKETDIQMSVMRIQYESSLKQLEEEINSLQKEKEEWLNTVKAVQASNNASKVSEQRRKRLQELEAKIAEMKKQVQEKARLLKMKQEAERKVSQLQQEIQNMKSARVKLMKQIREEAERYRALKVEKDREVTQLKQKDRKRQYELCKLKDEYNKEKNVMKRKMEEAAAANKRLKDALQQQKRVAERRTKEKQQTMQGIGSRVQQWLNQEIEVILSSKEAQHHLKILMEDRKTIVAQIDMLKKNLETSEPPEKRRLSGDSDEDTNTLEIRDQISALEREFQVRNVQIADLQRQITDVDQDEKMKHRWDSIQSMVEAKCAMKWLFETAINAKFGIFLESMNHKKEIETVESDLFKLKQKLKEVTDTNEKLNNSMRSLKSNHAEQIAKLIRENEDKTIYFLKQMNVSSSSVGSFEGESQLLDRIKFQEKEIERLSYLNEEIQKKDAEIKELKQQLTLSVCKGKKPRLFNSLYKVQPKNLNCTFDVDNGNTSAMEAFLLDNSCDDEDYDPNDPEWTLTPEVKRARAEAYRSKKQISFEGKGSTSRDSDNQCSEPKNSVSLTGCCCSLDCSTKRCGCHKQSRGCTSLCKCSKEVCVNRDDCSGSISNSSDCENENKTTVLKESNSVSQTVLTERNGTVNKNDSMNDFEQSSKLKKNKYSFETDSTNFINESGIKKHIFHNRSQKYFEPFSD